MTVFTDLIEKPTQDYLLVKTTRFKSEILGEGRVKIKADWHIKAIPAGKSDLDVIDTLQLIDEAFDRLGKRVLKVLDRTITIKNTNMFVLDNVGNYLFDTEIIIPYGTTEKYEKMENLELGGFYE